MFSKLQLAGQRFVLGVLVVSLAGLGLGLLGRFAPELDLLANARGHLIGIAIAAALGLWLGYRPVLVLMLGAFLTLASHALIAQLSQWPEPAGARAASTTTASWTILALNTWHHHPDPDGLEAYLAGTGADVLVLTEMGPNKIAILHALQDAYPYRKDCAEDWDCAVAVLSKHPFTDAGSVTESDTGGPARVWMTFGNGPATFTIVGTHIHGPLHAPRLHQFQLAQLAWDVRALPGRVLVAGDFNTTPWSTAFQDFTDQSGLLAMGHFLPTFPAGEKGLPQLAIDHMFASAPVKFEQVWLGPDVASDHRPVLARVTLPGNDLVALR